MNYNFGDLAQLMSADAMREDRRTDGQTNGWMDGWMDGQTGGTGCQPKSWTTCHLAMSVRWFMMAKNGNARRVEVDHCLNGGNGATRLNHFTAPKRIPERGRGNVRGEATRVRGRDRIYSETLNFGGRENPKRRRGGMNPQPESESLCMAGCVDG